MDRCSGHCCLAFGIPYSPEQLAQIAKREGSLRGDAYHVHAMGLHIGFSDVNPVTGRKWGGPVHFYACLYYDAETGDCRGYDERPRMCREYPYGRRCEEPGCTWENAAAATSFQLPIQIGGSRPKA